MDTGRWYRLYLPTLLGSLAAIATGCSSDPEPAAQAVGSSANPAAATAADTATEPPRNASPPAAPDAEAAAVASPPDIPDNCAADAPKVYGLCLGMTQAEAEAALRRYAADISIEESKIYFRYNDGVQTHNTPDILYQLIARVLGTGEQATLSFSPLPGEPRVVGIDFTRTSNLPTVDAYLEELTETYGPPASTGTDPAFGTAYQGNIQWSYPEGATACGRVPAGPMGGVVNTEARPGSNIANELARAGFPDPSQCPSVLQFSMNAPSQAEPIRLMRAEFIDIRAAAEAESAMFEWIQELEAEARAARQ